MFGHSTYVHVKQGKLESRAIKMHFLSVLSGVIGYKLWCPEIKKIIVSVDVTFDEFAMLNSM